MVDFAIIVAVPLPCMRLSEKPDPYITSQSSARVPD